MRFNGGFVRRRHILASYRFCKAIGLFALARRLTRSDLRILCYHGFVLDDEDRFRDSLFVSSDFLDRRMSYLYNQGYNVLPLAQAVERLRDGTLPPNTVTITIDDGFHSVHAIARKVLKRYNFPATLYLTSYYFEKATPIFRLAVDYMCWKSPRRTVDLSDLGITAFAEARALEFTPDIREWVSAQIYAHGAIELDEPGRVTLSQKLAELLDVDYHHIAQSRMLSLVTPDEARDLQRSGIAIELHTHRHHFPDCPAAAHGELMDNRAAVEPVIGRRMEHFCYPSGRFSEAHSAVLRSNAVKSATTCQSGLAHAGSDPLALPRILDDNRVSAIEFEAEMSGFVELIRRWTRKLHRPAAIIPCLDLMGTHTEALVFI